MKLSRKTFFTPFLLFFVAASYGCASTPAFDCDSARKRVIESDEEIKKSAADYHAAEAQKDAKYYGVKTARTLTCVSTLGLLCGLADTIAYDNTKTEKTAEESKTKYAEAKKLSEGLRKAMKKNRCPNIPDPS